MRRMFTIILVAFWALLPSPLWTTLKADPHFENLLNLCDAAGLAQGERARRLIDSIPPLALFEGWLLNPSNQRQVETFFLDLADMAASSDVDRLSESFANFRDQMLNVFRLTAARELQADDKAFEAFDRIINVLLYNDETAWRHFMATALAADIPRSFSRSILVPLAIESSESVQDVILAAIQQQYPNLRKKTSEGVDTASLDAPARTAAFLGQWIILTQVSQRTTPFGIDEYSQYLQKAKEVFSADYGLREVALVVKAVQHVAAAAASFMPMDVIEMYGSFFSGRARQGNEAINVLQSDLDLRVPYMYAARIVGTAPNPSEAAQRQLVEQILAKVNQELARVWQEHGHDNPPPPPASWDPRLPLATQGDVNGAFHLQIRDKSATLIVNRPPKLGELLKSPTVLTRFSFEVDPILAR